MNRTAFLATIGYLAFLLNPLWAATPLPKVYPGFDANPECVTAVATLAERHFPGLSDLNVYPMRILKDKALFEEALTAQGIKPLEIKTAWEYIQAILKSDKDKHPQAKLFREELDYYVKEDEILFCFLNVGCKGSAASMVQRHPSYQDANMRYAKGQPIHNTHDDVNSGGNTDKNLALLIKPDSLHPEVSKDEEKKILTVAGALGKRAVPSSRDRGLRFSVGLFHELGHIANLRFFNEWLKTNLSLYESGRGDECDILFKDYVEIREGITYVEETFKTLFEETMAVRTQVTAVITIKQMQQPDALILRSKATSASAAAHVEMIKKGIYGPGLKEALHGFKLGDKTVILDQDNFVSTGEEMFEIMNQTISKNRTPSSP